MLIMFYIFFYMKFTNKQYFITRITRWKRKINRRFEKSKAKLKLKIRNLIARSEVNYIYIIYRKRKKRGVWNKKKFLIRICMIH
jgi:hypothetical protein